MRNPGDESGFFIILTGFAATLCWRVLADWFVLELKLCALLLPHSCERWICQRIRPWERLSDGLPGRLTQGSGKKSMLIL